MATLEKIRNKAGLLVAVIGLALFAFIIGDFLRSGSTFFNQSKQKVVIVNGESVGIQEFQSKVEGFTNMYKNNGNGSIAEEEQNEIRQSVFDEIVRTLLLDEEGKKIGIAVEEEEIRDLLYGNNISPLLQQIPDFKNQQTGQFDKNALLRFLQSIETSDLSTYSPEVQQQILTAKESWSNLRKNIIEQKKLSKLETLLTSALVTSSLEAKASYDENAVSVDFNYVFQSYNAIPDSAVVVTNAEIEKLYNLRKNAFKQQKAKVIDYIAVNILPSETDFNEVSTRLEGVKSELLNTDNIADIIDENSDIPFLDVYLSSFQLTPEQRLFVENAQPGSIEGPTLADNVYNIYKLLDVKQAPDSIKVNQLTLPSFADESRLTALTDSLIGVLKAGKTFSELTSEMTNGQGNGDMGWQTEASLARGVDVKFMNALFNAKLNDVFALKSAYGTHLVQVVEKTQPVKKYKLGTVQVTVTPSTDTYNKLYTELNQYISKNNKLETFKTAATEAGYVCQTGIQVYENQLSLNPIRNSRQVVRWAFSHTKGDVSELFECESYFVAVAVEGTLKEGYQSLKEVSELLKRELINEKKGEKILADLKAKNISSLEDYAQAVNTSVNEVKFVTFTTSRITGIGVDPVVNAKALAAETGQITGPFAGKNGVYVLTVSSKNTSEQAYDEKTQKERLNQMTGYRLRTLFQNNVLLKENAKIEDNRSRFY